VDGVIATTIVNASDSVRVKSLESAASMNEAKSRGKFCIDEMDNAMKVEMLLSLL
jgi:hypothetical protein